MKTKKIDCPFWANIDEWPLIKASLLLSIIDPQTLPFSLIENLEKSFKDNREVNFSLVSEYLTIEEINKVKKIYTTLQTIEFGIKYSDSLYYSCGAAMYRQAYHPYLIIYEAHSRGLFIPKKLKESVEKRFFNETQRSICAIDADFLNHRVTDPIATSSKIKNKKVGDATDNILEEQKPSKKERNRLKAIGIMANMLAESSNKYRNGSNTNAKNIKDDILLWAEKNGIDDYGLKIIERDISAGVEYVEGIISNPD